MKPRFTSRRLESGDEVAINDLYRRVAGRSRSPHDWRWQWMENPAGPSEMWIIELEEDGRRQVVGHHGVMPFRATVGDRELMLGKTENTMVLQEVRHRLLYPRFEMRFLEQYGARFDALFSTRGPAAALRMRQALGYRTTEPILIASIGRRVRSPFGSLRRRLGGSASPPSAIELGACGPATATDLDDPGFLEAWSRGRPDDEGLHLVKDEAAVSWRYRRHPSGVYRGLMLDDAVAIVHRHDRESLWIDELAIRSDEGGSASGAWRDLWKVATSIGATTLLNAAFEKRLPDPSLLRAAGLLRWRTHPENPTEDDAMPVRLEPRDQGPLPEVRAWGIDSFVFEGPPRATIEADAPGGAP